MTDLETPAVYEEYIDYIIWTKKQLIQAFFFFFFFMFIVPIKVIVLYYSRMTDYIVNEIICMQLKAKACFQDIEK